MFNLLEKQIATLAGYSPWSHKESDMTEWLNTHIYLIYTYKHIYKTFIPIMHLKQIFKNILVFL